MRRLNGIRNERGASAVMFVLAIVPLLAVGAIAGDTGLLYWEKAQLQNGADAAALAVAEDCALNPDMCSGRATETATTTASGNANDLNSAALITDITVNPRSGSVTVVTSSPPDDGVEHPFASVIAPQDATHLQARATATWGVPVHGGVLPYAIGTCEFNDPRLTSGQEVVIENTNRTTCPGTGSPGGFGWLDSPDGCEAQLGLGDRIYGDTGSWGSNSGCDLSTVELCGTILVPVYDQISRNPDGTGSPSGGNAYYHIEKFAAFVFNGWKKDGAHNGACPGVPQLFNAANPSGGRWPNSGIQGHFVRFVSLDEAFELGEGPYAGVLKVELSG